MKFRRWRGAIYRRAILFSSTRLRRRRRRIGSVAGFGRSSSWSSNGCGGGGGNYKMADGCSSSVCALERRFMKKELLSWTKKIPILVGLEVLAEAIVGRDVLHELVDSTSGVELSQTLPEDWNASQPCSLCSGNTSDMGKFPEHGSWQNDGSVEMLTTANPSFPSYIGFSEDGIDSPLDLRRYPMNDQRSFEGDHVGKPVVELKVPRVVQKSCKHSASSSFGVKKNYTEQELVAATSEICSGKIGTRRASALYGIPRSTLRNKIFRLKSDVTAADENVEGSPALDSSKGVFTLDTFQGVDKIKTEYPPMDWKQNLDQLYDTGAVSGHFERPYKMTMPSSASTPAQSYFFEQNKELSSHGCAGPLLEPKLPFLQRLIQEFAEKQIKSEMEEHWRFFGMDFAYKQCRPIDSFFMDDGSSSELKIPYYKPLRSAEKVKDSYCPSAMPVVEWNTTESLSTMSRSNRINSVLKDVITKTISEKFRSHRSSQHSDMFFPSFNGNNNSEAFSSDSSLCSEPMAKQPRTQLLASLQMTMSTSSSPDFEASLADSRSTSGSSDGEKKQTKGHKNMNKKTRPKRGQYRKYNRQLLLEAVKAVQKGDMSVHRAGSYYGVPHSTLEYKVKERHLLRQKKSLDNCKSNESVAVGASAGSHGEEGFSTAQGANITCSKDTASQLTTHCTPPMLYCKDTQEDNCNGPNLPLMSPYSYRYPHEDGLLSVSSIPSVTTSSLPLPVGCFRGTLPVGFGWPPLMTGMFPLSSVPGPLFDAQVPNFGFSMSASDLLKRLQQKVQANLSSGHEMQREVNELTSVEDRLAPLSPEMNSGRSSTCSIGSPQVAVS